MNKYILLSFLLCALPTQSLCSSRELQSLLPLKNDPKESLLQRSTSIKILTSKEREDLHSSMFINTCGLSLCFPTARSREIAYTLYPDGSPCDEPAEDLSCNDRCDQCDIYCARKGCNPIAQSFNIALCGAMLTLIPTGVALDSNILTSFGVASIFGSCFFNTTMVLTIGKTDSPHSDPNNWQNGKYKPKQITTPEEKQHESI